MNGSENIAETAFGELLRRHRRAGGLTQAELAEASGISVRALSNLERGQARAAQRRSTEVLADALGLEGLERAHFLAAAKEGRRRTADRAAGGTIIGAPPPAVADLVGRTGELARLREAAEAAVDTPGGIVVSVVGHPGVGKTALVQTAAHALRELFPHGFLSIDLRGMDDQPVTERVALDSLLRSLGVPPGQIPTTVGEQSALYRSLLAGRRLLIVLDNAANEAQVRPLLAATTGCLTLITCRRALAGLESARWLRLSPLAQADASALVASIIGANRVAAEPGATAELVELCGNLPLAVRIAGNRLASRPDWSVGYLVSQLRDERTRLGALSAGDLRIRPAFEISHQRLSTAARLVFRRAAVVPGPDFGVELAAVATELPAAEVQTHLEELVDANILHSAGTAGRYTYHDLIRLYAREQLKAEEDPERSQQAEVAVLDHLLATATEAGKLFQPDALADDTAGRFTSRDQAGDWLDAESGNWLAAQRNAARCGRHREVLDLAKALHWYADGRIQQMPWDEVAELALAAARALGSRHEEAAMLNESGWASYYCLGDYEAGRAVLEEALALALRIGDRQEQTWALGYLGAVLMRLGRPEEALDHIRRSVAMSGELGFWLGQGTIRNALGQILCAVGRPDEGLAVHRAVLGDAEFYRDEANSDTYRMVKSFTLQLMGLALEAMEDWRQAAETFATARALFAAIPLSLQEADAALHEGMAWRKAGHHDSAIGALRFALSAFTGAMNRWERAQALAELAAALEHSDPAEAREYREEAIALCEELGTEQATALAARLADPRPRVGRLSDRLQAARNHAFTGRAEELAFLHAARRAEEPPFTVLWLYGPAGVGKSALMQRFADDAVADGESCLILDARTFEPTPQGFRSALGSPDWPAGLRLLLLDTAETIGKLETWLRETFLPTAPERAILIVASREKPAADWIADSAWWKALRAVPVRDLPPDEGAELLMQRGIAERDVPGALRFTQCRPLALALAADVLAHRGGASQPWAPDAASEPVSALMRELLRQVPSERHRAALEVLGLARVTTSDLLRHGLVDQPADVGALFEWLRGLSFVQTAADGLVAQRSAREALVADLRSREPRRFEEAYRRVYRHLVARMLDSGGACGHRNVLDVMYLSRYGPMGEFFDWDAIMTSRIEPAVPGDEQAVLDMLARLRGPETARLAAQWWRAQLGAFTVLRRRDGTIEGLMVMPRLTGGESPVPEDPVANAALDQAREQPPMAPDEHLVLARWLVGEATYPGSHGSVPMACHLVLNWVAVPGTALSYTVLPDGNEWGAGLSFVGQRRLADVADVDGYVCTPFVFDWRQVTPQEWAELMEDRQLAHRGQIPVGTH